MLFLVFYNLFTGTVEIPDYGVKLLYSNDLRIWNDKEGKVCGLICNTIAAFACKD